MLEETTLFKGGSSAVRLGKGRGKKKKSYYNTGCSYLITHPSTNFDEQGLTLMSGGNMLLSLCYSDSTLNTFF